MRTKSLKNSMLVFTASNFINASIPFLLLPILTNLLAKDEYGILSLFQVTISLILPFVTIQFHAAIRVNYFKIDKDEIPSYISSALLIPLLSTPILILIFYLVGDLIFVKFNLQGNWMILIPIFSLLQVIPSVLLILFQVKEKAFEYGCFIIFQTSFNLILSIIFVHKLQFGWEGRLYGIFITYLLFSIIGIIIIYKMQYLINKIQKKNIMNILGFGIPLIPHAVGGIVIPACSRYMLANMKGLNEVGLYTVGFQVANIMAISVFSINQAFSPYIYKKLKLDSEPIKKILVKQTYLICLLMILLFLALNLVSPIIFKYFIAPEYHLSIKYVFWLGLGFLFQGFYFMAVNYIFFVKKTYILGITTFSNALLNILLTYIFINLYGTIGAAYAFALSFIIFFITSWFLSNKVFPMPWLLR